MLNWLHSRLHNPHRGWDPIARDYAEDYARLASADLSVVDTFERSIAGLASRRVADIGSGPGSYAVEFAKRGAQVTCVDISRNYLELARARLTQAGCTGEYVLGYIDHVARSARTPFDAVFSNVSWYYCMSDRSFARELLRAVVPGGVIFVRQTTADYDTGRSLGRRLIYATYRHTGLKIGHPHPARGRIAWEFTRLDGCAVKTDYTHPLVDVVVVTKKALSRR